ncbi:hypothetical protein [Streptomyces sp. CNQ085]|uniref:hypothetical protein n=1 Tax=Streptomyces sp. CNQ085 TaxID=2886944 RepID=UPI001F5106D9|nr:hypothetical protein [Streptomyces sp. CNQ085]MCI0385337.1 hypothetical protein [Streptomyces sp. CNQ085]
MDEPMSGSAPETEPAARGPVGEGTEPGEEAPAGGGGPRPPGLHVVPTGDAGVDARLRRLADADHLAVPGHLEVYEDVHRGLRDTLTALDQRPGPPAPGAPHNPGS